uniref:Mu-like prophage FluMu protein gp27 n=1 Tax=uncultured Spirochaetaceae bacterium TaxID=201186 RepID=A0A650ENB5_9SPIO|nr:Mu-like prophage FluMu protein gp27 [uncultured Spirochaetaceae bacterium]
MGQKSSIDRLPSELRQKLIEMLQNPAVTQMEVVETINAEAGESVVSRSGVNRYKMRMDKFAAKTREAREVAATYIEKVGADSRNRMGKLANEQLRIMVFDLLLELEDLKNEDEGIAPEIVTDILFKTSRAMKELEQAEKLNSQRTEEIKSEVLKETAAKVETVAKKRGVSKEAMSEIMAEVFGITE